MSPAEELAIAGHAVTARQVAAAIDAFPGMDGQLIDSLSAIAKLAARLSDDLSLAANA